VAAFFTAALKNLDSAGIKFCPLEVLGGASFAERVVKGLLSRMNDTLFQLFENFL
jgi:hypothetical protein